MAHDSAALFIAPVRLEDSGIEILCHLQNSIGAAMQRIFLHHCEKLELCVLARDNSISEVREEGGNGRGRKRRGEDGGREDEE